MDPNLLNDDTVCYHLHWRKQGKREVKSIEKRNRCFFVGIQNKYKENEQTQVKPTGTSVYQYLSVWVYLHRWYFRSGLIKFESIQIGSGCARALVNLFT